jgi:D-alanyl-D-alanine carboxypeptidase
MNQHSIDAAISFIGSWLPYQFAQCTIPGLSVAVAYKGKHVFSQQYGVASLEDKSPLGPQHRFGAASQSKMTAAVAAMQLVEGGKMSLDTQVHRYLPWFASHPDPRAADITPRQLLTHTAGFMRDLPNADFWIYTMPFPDRQAVHDILLSLPIVADPNTTLKYSNAGYVLLGLLVEAVAQTPFTDYVHHHIYQPADMHHSQPDYADSALPDSVPGYGMPLAGTRPVLYPRQPAHALAAVAGMYTTADDLCRFANCLCEGNQTLLREASKRELLRTHWTQPDGYDAGTELAMGFEVARSLAGRRLVGHSGHIAGHLSATYFDPQSTLTVAVLANSKDAPSPRIALSIIDAFDFFAEAGTLPVPQERSRFGARLFSPIATVEIIAAATRIAAIDPADWQPFAYIEDLEQVGENTLRVVTPGSIFNTAETVTYQFAGTDIAAVSYAGNTLLPIDIYRAVHDMGPSGI